MIVLSVRPLACKRNVYLNMVKEIKIMLCATAFCYKFYDFIFSLLWNNFRIAHSFGQLRN